VNEGQGVLWPELGPVEPEEVIDTRPNPMVRAFGEGPEGVKCKNCIHLYAKVYHPNRYYKCDFRKDTNGAGTDHRVNWQSCRKYEPEVQL
jgi:hypothetical protein